MKWFTDWLDRRRRAQDWRVERQWSRECRWSDIDASAGNIIVNGEQNGLGQRRAFIVLKPDSMFSWKDTRTWKEAVLWANEIRPRNTDNPPKLRAVK